MGLKVANFHGPSQYCDKNFMLCYIICKSSLIFHNLPVNFFLWFLPLENVWSVFLPCTYPEQRNLGLGYTLSVQGVTSSYWSGSREIRYRRKFSFSKSFVYIPLLSFLIFCKSFSLKQVIPPLALVLPLLSVVIVLLYFLLLYLKVRNPIMKAIVTFCVFRV